MYKVIKITKDGKFYGPVHSSNDAEKTTCGIEITGDGKWYILEKDSKVTCKRCKNG